MMAFFGSLSVIPWILFAQASWSMDAVPATSSQSRRTRDLFEILDRGELFQHGLERSAAEALRSVPHGKPTPILIETVRSLNGAWVADVARRHARSHGGDQLYILIAVDESDVAVVGAHHGPASRFTDQERETIRRAFLGPLRAGQPDAALNQGISAITKVLNRSAGKFRLRIPGKLIPSLLFMSVLFVCWAWVRARFSTEADLEPKEIARRPMTATAVPWTIPTPLVSVIRERATLNRDQPSVIQRMRSLQCERTGEPTHFDRLGAESKSVGEIAMRETNSKIYMTRFDRDRLANLLERPHTPELDGYFHSLRAELNRAEVVDAEEIPPDVVTMNSTVRLIDVTDSEEDEYTLVFPNDADADAGRISVMAPLGTAMLGYRVGDVFDWDVPMGRKRWRVARIVYQPEAAGDYNV